MVSSINKVDNNELNGARIYTTRRKLLSLVKNSGIYHRLRASFVYDLYLTLTNWKLLKDRNREAAFYRAVPLDSSQAA
jgi:hypothetical protein